MPKCFVSKGSAKRAFRAAVGAKAIALALVALPAANAATGPLSASLGSGATFPARTLILSAPAGVPVSVPHMYIWENGGPVYYLKVTPLNKANAGELGVVLVIDQSASMSGAPLAHAVAAARALAAQRTGKQELGVIAFNSHPTMVLPLTSDPAVIDHALAATPRTAEGRHILPALALALKQLSDAKIADGAVILVSDGAATGSVGNVTPQSVASAARAQHVPIFTVGLRDRSSNFGALRRLAQLGGGEFAASPAAQLSHTLTTIGSTLTSSYLVRYQSIVSASQDVAVKIHVDGVPTLARLGYYAPAAKAGATASGSGSSQPSSILPQSPSPGAPQPTFASQPAWTPTAAHHVFWSSSLAALAVAGGIALLIAIAIAVLLFSRPDGRDLRSRVNSFLAVARADPTDRVLADDPAGPLARLLKRSRRWPAFVEQVHTARMQRSALDLVKRWTIASALAAVVLVEATGTALLGLLLLLVAPFLLRAWVSRGAGRQRIAFSDQLPSNLQDLAGAMRAGRSLVGAITAVAETAIEPVRGEFERAVSDERLGMPLEETLEAIGRRMEAKDMQQVALIAALHRSSGSNAAEALDRVAEGARERADMIREMRALTGQARLSSWVLSGLPPAMLVALSVLAPSYSRPLFHTPAGIVLLVIGTGMVLSGWKVMNKITNPEA
jgi:tight adherence protein B